jgi:glycerophosphoryl diester phosphodiesterase
MTLHALLALILLGLSVGTLLAQTDPTRVEVVAHRGASADAPENTLAALKEGWRQGADAVELDVWLTADHRVVLMHDEKLERTTGAPGLVTTSTWSELRGLDAGSWKGPQWAGEPIPLLEQALETIPDGKRAFVEIKHGVEIVPHIAPLILASGKAPEQIVFISFSQPVCEAIKRELPAYEVLRLSGFKQDEDNGSYSPTIDSLIEQAKAAKLEGLDLSWKGPHDAESIQRIKDAGLFFAVWTVNTPETAQEMAKLGAQSITTDHPGKIREWLAAGSGE